MSGFNATGFIDQSVTLYHESSDCEGPAFVREAADPVIRIGRVRDGLIYYAGDPVTTHAAILSTQQSQASCVAPDTVTSLGLCCHNANPGTRTLGPLRLLDPTAVFGAPPWSLRP